VAAASPDTIRAVPIAGPVTLDGALTEPFWATTDSIDDLRQREPVEGSPATERTVVRVAHDADARYIAVRCYDSDARFRFPDTGALSRPLNGAVVVKVDHRLTP